LSFLNENVRSEKYGKNIKLHWGEKAKAFILKELSEEK